MLQKVEQAILFIVDHLTIQCVLLMTHVLAKAQDAADGKCASILNVNILKLSKKLIYND
jgi:hypothetical protein